MLSGASLHCQLLPSRLVWYIGTVYWRSHISSWMLYWPVRLIPLVPLHLQMSAPEVDHDWKPHNFYSCHTSFWPNMSQHIGNFELSLKSRRYRSGLSNCWEPHMHVCAAACTSNFRALIICSGRRDSRLGMFTCFWMGPPVKLSTTKNQHGSVPGVVEVDGYIY